MPHSTAPPAVQNSSWIKDPLDAFILQKLEAAKLTPARELEKAALLRRASFDLTGLPPTPAQLDAFLADTSANAFEKAVDRLLASPRFGERWARHWLDLVRYAESHGHEFDFTIPNDHPDTKKVLAKSKTKDMKVYVGCAKWNSKDLKGFYPKEVKAKDELHYYSTQFNCIELNATFYKRYWENNYTAWREGVVENFKFFPKFNQGVTHYSRLKDVEERCEQFAENVVFLKEKLGMPFLQMHDNFGAGGFERFTCFLGKRARKFIFSSRNVLRD